MFLFGLLKNIYNTKYCISILTIVKPLNDEPKTVLKLKLNKCIIFKPILVIVIYFRLQRGSFLWFWQCKQSA